MFVALIFLTLFCVNSKQEIYSLFELNSNGSLGEFNFENRSQYIYIISNIKNLIWTYENLTKERKVKFILKIAKPSTNLQSMSGLSLYATQTLSQLINKDEGMERVDNQTNEINISLTDASTSEYFIYTKEMSLEDIESKGIIETYSQGGDDFQIEDYLTKFSFYLVSS